MMIAVASACRRSPLWLVLFASSICRILFDKRCLSALKLLSSSTEHCTDLAMRYVNSELDKNYACLRFAFSLCGKGRANIADKKMLHN